METNLSVPSCRQAGRVPEPTLRVPQETRCSLPRRDPVVSSSRRAVKARRYARGVVPTNRWKWVRTVTAVNLDDHFAEVPSTTAVPARESEGAVAGFMPA
jgi:hypothetical protein